MYYYYVVLPESVSSNAESKWKMDVDIRQIQFPALRDVMPSVDYVKEKCAKVQVIKSFLSTVIEEHKRDFDENNIRDFIDAYIKEIKASRKEISAEDQKKGNKPCSAQPTRRRASTYLRDSTSWATHSSTSSLLARRQSAPLCRLACSS